ncbi:MAG: hypothetical protein LBV06_08400 [Propionibacteriaceae bacterium]|jgi:hypothetical protein|nr:hypothetical protein [Propionibacteriaceae bacterium]
MTDEVREPKLARVPEAARLTSVGEYQLRDWCRKGKLRNYSSDSHWRVDINQIWEVLALEGAERQAEKQRGGR